MSKSKLIKLLKDDVWTLRHHLSNMSKQELRTFLIRVLKEQDRDTRHGCAEVIVDANRESACVFDCDFKYETHNACINYQDKDLVGL